MENIFNKLTGVTVEETPTYIKILGLHGTDIVRLINKHYGTTRLSNNIFSEVTGRRLVFYKFFAPDIVFILQSMLDKKLLGKNTKPVKLAIDLLYSKTWLSSTKVEHVSRFNYSKLTDLVYEALPYQREFLEYYDKVLPKYRLKGTLVNAAAGTGKTFMSLAVSLCLEATKVVIICPKAAVDEVWIKSLNHLFTTPQPYWTARDKLDYKNEKYTIFHYETLSVAMDMLPKLKTSNTVIILDESHNLNELTANRTISFIDFCSKMECNNIMLLSGTPFKALTKEAITLFKVIDPFFTDKVTDVFKKIFRSDNKVGVDILNERLGYMSHVIIKSVLDIQKPIINDLKIVMDDPSPYTLKTISGKMREFVAERKIYYASRDKEDKALFARCLEIHKNTLKSKEQHIEFDKYNSSLQTIQSFYKAIRLSDCKEELIYCNSYEKNKIIPSLPPELKNKFKDVKAIIKYLGLKIQGECLGRILSRARIDCHRAMIPFIPFTDIMNTTVKKTLVFTSFADVVTDTTNYLNDNGYKCLNVYGGNKTDLTTTVSKFEKEEQYNPLVATYMSLSTAVPLVMADVIIAIDVPFRAYIFEQAVSRIYRLGATSQTYVYRITLDTGEEPNISSRSVDILKWSQEQVELITGVKNPLDNANDITLDSISIESYDLEDSMLSSNVVPSYNSW
jgi:SNF2 family DNA or RNA helicase